MKTYIIAKSTRTPGSVSYNGPTCERAGVIGGQVYTNIEMAEEDARKLTECNPVGFVVYDLDMK